MSERVRPRLACHYWSIYHLEIEEATRWARDAGYDGMDLGSGDLGQGARLDAAALASDPAVAHRLIQAADEAGISYTDLFVALPFAPNDPDADHQQQNLEILQGVVDASHAIGIPVLTFSPGFAGENRAEATARSAETLRRWVDLGQTGGVRISVEAHIESVADSPERALALVAAVPGLGLTLDYSHFVAGGYAQAEVEPLHPHAVHVHTRQSRPGVLAVPVADGAIDFRRVLGLLHADGYDGAITVEYVSSPWQGQDQVDSARENDLMRREIRGLIDELWGAQ